MATIPKRESLNEIESRYNDGTDRATLQNLVKAFKYIQALDPDDPNSFYCIAGFHGEPFRGVEQPKDWWGGYCHHEDVLFPLWHRAYLLRIENALRKAPGCDKLRLPFWDELLPYPTLQNPPLCIPVILTSPQFEGEANPLYSYKLQRAFGNNKRYAKPKDYATVRYPLSGLVGTKTDEEESKRHNAQYQSQENNVNILNQNVANWLTGHVELPDEPGTRRPDVTSVYERYQKCLTAPNYTVFSNTSSQSQHNTPLKSSQTFVVSLESPHNAIHLAIGGFYQKGVYNASPIKGANGDMGANEVAGFDPIFFFHHCFIDYAFWTWQKKHGHTAEGSIQFIKGYKGTQTDTRLPVPEGAPPMPKGTELTLDTPLYPFLKSDARTYYASKELVDIKKQLGYDYGRGSLDPVVRGEPYGIHAKDVPVVLKISGINRGDYVGSFVVRLYGHNANGDRVEVGREAVLSRWELSDCANCQNSLEQEFFIPLHKNVIDYLAKEDGEFRTVVGIQTHVDEKFPTEKGKVPDVVTM